MDEVTYQGYESLANSHILPYFDASGLKLQQVTRQLLQDYMDEKAAHGRKDGKGGLSPRSLRLHKNILYQALTEAVKAGLLSANPCEYIDLPSVPRHEAHFYTAEQVQTLLDSIRDDPLFPLVKITAIYGLRRSELLGLQWDSIDFESGTLTIRHTVSKVTKPVEKDKTKNASSYRSFPLLPEARAIFLQALSDQRTTGACSARHTRRTRMCSNGRMAVRFLRTISPIILPACSRRTACPASASTNCGIAVPAFC